MQPKLKLPLLREEIAKILFRNCRCWIRMQDTSCAWSPLNLCLPTSSNIQIISSPEEGICVPLGSRFPGIYSLHLQADNGSPLEGYNVRINSPANDTSLYIHTGHLLSASPGGNISVASIFLDYGDPGSHSLNFSISEFASQSFIEQSVLSQPFYIADELSAVFIQQPASPVLLRELWLAPPEVQLVIRRKCESIVFRDLSNWIPPTLELFLLNIASNYTEGPEYLSRQTTLTGTETSAVLNADGVALATFSNFSVVDGVQGLYSLGVRVKGSARILGKSSPFLLRSEAVELNVLDLPAKIVNADTYLKFRVLANAENGKGMYNVPITASLQFLVPSVNASLGGSSSNQQVSGSLDYSSSIAYTNQDGVAYFNITFASYATYPYEFMVLFESKGSYNALSAAFSVFSPIKSVEILSGVVIAPMYLSRWVWPLLKARTIRVGLQTYAQAVPVRETPLAMLGSFTAETGALDNPTLRLKDHRNQAIGGLLFNVTLVDFQGQDIDSVEPATEGLSIAQDEGYVHPQAGISCVVNSTKYDCQGLYAFPILGTSSSVRTGFYTFQFSSAGLTVLDHHELLFVNIVLPDTLYKVGYLVGLACSILCSVMIFQVLPNSQNHFFEIHECISLTFQLAGS